MPTRALTWAIFIAATVIVAGLCVAILRPFAHVIAWAATLAILGYPLQQKLVERTGRVAMFWVVGIPAAVIDNVLRPRLVAGRVGLSELAMFFALLGGLSVFGALGVVLGPVAFATAAAIVEALRQPAVAGPSGGRQS